MTNNRYLLLRDVILHVKPKDLLLDITTSYELSVYIVKIMSANLCTKDLLV